MAKQTQFDIALEHAMNAAVKRKDVTKLPPPVRTLALVHAAQGAIDNGGLQYFFESDFPGKPDYALFVEAYRAIGADDAATTLERAVALFPFDAPHKHVRKRNEFLDSFLDEDEEPVNSPFEPLTDKLCGNKSVWAKLKKYVAAHSAYPEDSRCLCDPDTQQCVCVGRRNGRAAISAPCRAGPTAPRADVLVRLGFTFKETHATHPFTYERVRVYSCSRLVETPEEAADIALAVACDYFQIPRDKWLYVAFDDNSDQWPELPPRPG